MYCSKCGTQLPDGTQFCSQCGAKQGAAAGSQTTVNQTAVNQTAPPRVNPKSSGVTIQTWPMVIDILYAIELVLMMIMAGDPMSMLPVLAISAVVGIAYTVVVIVDLVYLSKIGIRGGWKWSVLIYPLYLFLRAKKTDGKYIWAIICVVEMVIALILSASFVGPLMWML